MTTLPLSPTGARNILSALQGGVVPESGLRHFAVGLDLQMRLFSEELLPDVGNGGGRVKAIVGGYGAGKTFMVGLLADEALQAGFALSRVQLDLSGVRLFKLDEIYAAIVNNLRLDGVNGPALQVILDAWVQRAEDDVLSASPELEDTPAFREQVDARINFRLDTLAREQPALGVAMRAYARARQDADGETMQLIAGWFGGSGGLAAGPLRRLGLKTQVTGELILPYLRGLLTIIRDSGQRGLVLVLDELDLLRRLKSDSRKKALNNLLVLVNDILGGRFPGLLLALAVTPEALDGPRGFNDVEALLQRFIGHPEDPSGPRLYLPAFDRQRLLLVLERVSDLHRVAYPDVALDAGLPAFLADAWMQAFGGRVDRLPRLVIMKYLAELGRKRFNPSYDPYREYHADASDPAVTPEERGDQTPSPEVEEF